MAQAPLMRYVLVGTLAIAIWQGVSPETEAVAPAQVMTAGLFGSGTQTAWASQDELDLAALHAHKPAVARYAKELGLDRSALEATTLLLARDGAEADVAGLAERLRSVAVARGAYTPGGWVEAASTLFGDAARAEAELRYLIRRYGL